MEPKRYRALHITPGVVDYTDGDQRETVLIKKPALDKMNRSFLGKPVFNFTHKVVDIENAFDFTSEESDKHAVGLISNVGYDVESGYYFADMMIWDEETQSNIENGYGVSNAYVPEVGPGGEYNSVPYDEEVTGGEYNHMAIVENPRYEEVRIFENSKRKKPMSFTIKWGKKRREAEAIKANAIKAAEKAKLNAADPPDDKEKEKEGETKINADSVLVGEDGEEYPLSEMMEAWKNSNMGDPDDKTTLNMDDEIDVDGKKVTMKELYDNYTANKNAENPTDQPLDDVVKKNVKKNSADDKGKEKEKESEKEKPNANFLTLKTNANKGADPDKIKLNTQKSRLERGKKLYGSEPVQAKAQGGN